jgi:hypothetical protein
LDPSARGNCRHRRDAARKGRALDDDSVYLGQPSVNRSVAQTGERCAREFFKPACSTTLPRRREQRPSREIDEGGHDRIARAACAFDTNDIDGRAAHPVPRIECTVGLVVQKAARRQEIPSRAIARIERHPTFREVTGLRPS